MAEFLRLCVVHLVPFAGPGIIVMLTLKDGSLRRTTSVAKQVQRLSLVGKGIPEIASRTELFPED
jgi:hypothetical protein